MRVCGYKHIQGLWIYFKAFDDYNDLLEPYYYTGYNYIQVLWKYFKAFDDYNDL